MHDGAVFHKYIQKYLLPQDLKNGVKNHTQVQRVDFTELINLKKKMTINNTNFQKNNYSSYLNYTCTKSTIMF